VALTLHVVLTTAELDDGHFVVAALGNHFSGDFGTIDHRSADLHIVAIADQQNAVKGDSFASRNFEFFNLEVFAFGNLVLLAAGYDNCVHLVSPLILLTQRFERMIGGWHGCMGPEGDARAIA